MLEWGVNKFRCMGEGGCVKKAGARSAFGGLCEKRKSRQFLYDVRNIFLPSPASKSACLGPLVSLQDNPS